MNLYNPAHLFCEKLSVTVNRCKKDGVFPIRRRPSFKSTIKPILAYYPFRANFLCIYID